jgi:micrococcal nuclease
MSLLGAHRHGPLRYVLIAVVVFWTLSFGLPSSPTHETSPRHEAVGVMQQESVSSSSSSSLGAREEVEVVRVVDGDTVRIVYQGKEEVVRLIGLNAPESVDPRRPVECFGQEASLHLQSLLRNSPVTFRADMSQDVRDKYGRLLGYLVEVDGMTINERMIRDGYAYEYTYREPYELQSTFRQSEKVARAMGRGLFADGACGLPNMTPQVIPASSSSTSVPVLCETNVYDCKVFGTQREAQALFLACGGPASDPHRLDVDHDGVVCESLP